MNRQTRWAAVALALSLLGGIAGCVQEPINQDNRVRTDPNPHKPDPTHPVYFLYNMHFEDIPGGAHGEVWEGSSAHRFVASPGVDDSMSLRYPPGGVFLPGEVPKGISLNAIVKATTPRVALPAKFKPKLFCSITKVDAVKGVVIDIIRPEHSSSDRVNGVICRGRAR